VDAGEVYRLLAPSVLAYLRGQAVPDPEDVLGEVFVQVARSLPRFRGDGDEALRRWVFTIARHRVVDDARRRARRPRSSDAPMPQVAAPPEPVELDGELLDALRRLTPPQREVVALRFVADLSLNDVARITRRSVGAVKSLQVRGLEELARILSGRPDAE